MLALKLFHNLANNKSENHFGTCEHMLLSLEKHFPNVKRWEQKYSTYILTFYIRKPSYVENDIFPGFCQQR